MARPTFFLTDDQARALLARADELNAAFPLSERSHRPYVRAFIAAVHEVLGKIPGPSILRRLLQAYAPGRSPSTATLALEKELHEREQRSVAATTANVLPDTPPSPTASMQGELPQGLSAALERLLARASGADQLAASQLEFLQKRLNVAERELAEARRDLQQKELELAQERARAEALTAEVERSSAGTAVTATHLAALEQRFDDMRKFALTAIDEARGETRAWKERSQYAEQQVKEQLSLTETFRRLAYSRGADIPAVLSPPLR
jgi:hypothetical protein